EGTFGGLVVNGETQGATAGTLASNLLNGVPISKLPIIKTSPNTPMFDHQALMRFGLSIRNIPAGSRLINPPDSLLDRYQNFIWPTIGLLGIETLLIALLLLNFIWRRRSEQRLKASEADFKKLIEASPIPLRVSRLGGEIIYVNKQFREMFGYTTKDIPTLQQWFEKAYPDPEYRAQIVDFWNDEVEKNARIGTPIAIREWRIRCKDGSEREIAFGHTQLSELGVTTMFDVTERNRVLRERQELEQKILQAQKMESLGVLAGGVAHDFNNLLTGILGGANLTLRKLPAESPLRARVETIAKSAERAADLTRQMLDYSGQGHFVVETLDLNLIVDEMIQLLKSAISKDAMLRIELAQISVPVEADATQIRQVVMNLITNASDALQEKPGVISISTGVMHADTTYLAGSYLNDDLEPGNYAFVEISDTGNGMTEETQTRIFDPFFTTKFTGRGLGLAAVLGIIRGHQGAIRIYSEPGAGTSFKILFPCRSNAQIAKKQEQTFPIPTDLVEQCGAVLIVDDDATVRSVGHMMLEEYGFTIFSAEDGEAGLEQLRQHPQIGLVLLDLTMPKLNGEQVFREIRKTYSQTRVILSSGYNEQDATAHFIGKGLAGFLHKPYRTEDLLQKIVQVLTNA
ncbi:MAG: response regulator, partial [Geopsychrobacter sp.]|nr:response regulator [Geopsychrobacter sp.]